MTPLKRFYNLLELDKKDVSQIFFYAIFAGLISLSLPLGIHKCFLDCTYYFSRIWCSPSWNFVLNAIKNYRKLTAKNICSFLF
jgi:hypothetical protein